MRTIDNKAEILFLNNLRGKFDKAFLCEILDKYLPAFARNDESTCILSFAWEGIIDAEGSFINMEASNIANADVLVVIGYSFPFFNREVDRAILKSIESLTKIYIQSPDAWNILERMEAVAPKLPEKEFILKHDILQFFLPNEL